MKDTKMSATEKRFIGVAFELYVAKYYQNKVNQCNQRGIDWHLTINDVRRILARKKCAYSGIDLTHTSAGKTSDTQRFTDLTLERKDSSKGYTKENTIAVCYGFNNIKGQFENPTCEATIKHLKRFANAL